MRLRKPLARLTFAAAVLLAGCSLINPSPWHSRYNRDHPLVGRFWSTGEQAFVSWQRMVDDAASAPFVLIGEDHENQDHHALQARVFAALVTDRGRRPALVMEMLDSSQEQAISDCRASTECDPATFGRMVGWDKSGWPTWRWYAPIVDVALKQGLPVVAGNLPRSRIRLIARAGRIDAALERRLVTTGPLEDSLEGSLEEEIRASHCYHVPEALVTKMALAQRVRDAQMAEVLSRYVDTGAVLIAGTGHVRKDRGVPLHLAMRLPQDRVVSIAPLEVRRSLREPSAYAAAIQAKRLPFDYVWFSPRADNKNPCERFKSQLEKIGKHKRPGT